MYNYAVFACLLLATVNIGSSNAARNCSAVLLDTTHLSATLEQANKTIHKKEVELGAEKRRTANLMKQIDRYMKRGDDLHGKLDKCTQQRMQAENVTVTLRADLSASKQRCTHVELLCKSDNVSNSDIWEQVNLRSNLSLCKQRETHLQAKLSRAQQANTDLTKQLNESRVLIPILKTDMEYARQGRLKAENVSHALRREVVGLKSELASFNQSSVDLQDEIVTIKQRSNMLSKQLEICRKKLKLQLPIPEEGECHDSDTNVEEARLRLEKERKRRSKAERNLKVSKQEMGRLKVDAEDLEEQLTGCRTEQGNERKQLLKAEREIKFLKQQLTQLKYDYESAKQESEKLEEQVLDSKLQHNKEVDLEKKLRIRSERELKIVKQELMQTRSDLSEDRLLSATGLHKMVMEKLKFCFKSAKATCQQELMRLLSALHGNVSKQFEDAKLLHKLNLTEINRHSETENTLKPEYRHMQEINKLTSQLNETQKRSAELTEQLRKVNDTLQCLRDGILCQQTDHITITITRQLGCNKKLRALLLPGARRQDNDFTYDCSRGVICFLFSKGKETGDNAAKKCQSRGGQLATVHSTEENNWLYSQARSISSNDQWLIAPHRVTANSTTFKNPDGSNVCYSNWHSGEPNNSGGYELCTHLNFFNDNTWNDIYCYRAHRFICEISAFE